MPLITLKLIFFVEYWNNVAIISDNAESVKKSMNHSFLISLYKDEVYLYFLYLILLLNFLEVCSACFFSKESLQSLATKDAMPASIAEVYGGRKR